jgi:hypothetical protein
MDEAAMCCSSRPLPSIGMSSVRVNSPSAAFPGMASIEFTLSHRARRHAIAYSRPPPPSTSALIPAPVPARPGLRLARCWAMVRRIRSASLNHRISRPLPLFPFDRGRRLR